MIKKFTLFIASLILFFAFISSVQAGDLNVTCSPGNCNSTGDDPLFQETNILPGWQLTKTIAATNGYAETRQFALELYDYQNNDSLGGVIQLNIKESGSATNLFSGSLTDFNNAGYLLLTNIGSGLSQDYDLTALFPTWVGNDFQAKIVIFNLRLGFGMLIPTSTPTQTQTQTLTSSSEGTTEDSSPTPTPAPTPGGGIVHGIFEEGIFGATDEETVSPTPIPSGETKGVSQECITQRPCLPWILLILQAIILLLIEFFSDKSQIKRKRILAVLVTLISIILFYLLRDCHCYPLGTFLAWLCKWYWLVAILFTLILRTITKFLSKGKPSSNNTEFNPGFSPS